MQSIGDQIKQIRLSLGMTQQQLGARSGLAQSMIAGIENGRLENLTMPTLHKLAQGLNCRFFPQFVAEKDIDVIREEQSEYIARKIISISSGSAAIEMQLPDQQVIDHQVETLKNELLEKGGSALWQKI